MTGPERLAILGTGNIGRAMALGLVAAGRFQPEQIILTRRKLDRIADLAERGFQVQSDNPDAVRRAEVVVVAVEPHQLDGLLHEIRDSLESGRHLLISVVSGADLAALASQLNQPIDLVRAMPNTAIALGQSMTCLALNTDSDAVKMRATEIFRAVGMTVVIEEELMMPATALCACGIAFFLRAIRSASQGGTEIGFHPTDALTMAAQTALGAASLVLTQGTHPERGIDSVTTPRGCTIAGLNEMEHQGFSSAMIKGIVTSAAKAASLYDG